MPRIHASNFVIICTSISISFSFHTLLSTHKPTIPRTHARINKSQTRKLIKITATSKTSIPRMHESLNHNSQALLSFINSPLPPFHQHDQHTHATLPSQPPHHSFFSVGGQDTHPPPVQTSGGMHSRSTFALRLSDERGAARTDAVIGRG